MDDTYGIIYCIENTVNNKKYIGQTIRTLEERMHDHYTHMNYKDSMDRTLYKAMRKYGKDNFKSYIIDTASSQKELDNKETYWITYYDTFQGKGYNMTSGGQNEKSNHDNMGELRNMAHKEFYVFDLNGDYLFERKSQSAFAKEIKCNHGTVGGCISGRKPTVKGYILISKNDYNTELLHERLDRIKHNSHIKPNFVVINMFDEKILGIWNHISTCANDLKLSNTPIRESLNHSKLFYIKKIPYLAIYETNLNEKQIVKFNKYKEMMNIYETTNNEKNG